ncbi:MAG: hypothetical protein AAF960_21600, partial [Bacteroidota bacterium]
MKKIIQTFLISGLVLLSSQLFSQSEQTFQRPDVVYLKNGSIFRGQIESYKVGGKLKLTTAPGRVLIFEEKNIKKIVQETTAQEAANNPKLEMTQPKTYDFRETGVYYAVDIGYLGGNSFFGEYTNAFTTHLAGGYQFNRWVGAGVGVGVDFYNVNLGSMIPVYAEFRGYFRKSRVSPFYKVAAGMGLPIENSNGDFTETKGGYYLAPSLGIRF